MTDNNLLDGLNPQQIEAVINVDSPLRVIAGAGSGKTKVIVQKITHLINLGFSPRSLVAITFTNKAAQEMSIRLNEQLPKDLVQHIKISTFHALGLNIIQSSLLSFDLRPNFSLLNDLDSKNLIKDIVGGHKSDWLKIITSLIDQWKNGGIHPQQSLELAENEIETSAALSFFEYERQKTKLNMLDFSDLLLKPLAFLQSNNPDADAWRRRFQYLLIDEYQDTNRIQNELFCCLADKSKRFTIVGDADQSIYSWRGALPENMTEIEVQFPEIKTIVLSQNYRSTNNILLSANRLISSLSSDTSKKLWSRLGDGREVTVLPCHNDRDEANKVLEQIRNEKVSQRADWSNFCIMYRSNWQGEQFEQILRQSHIPYTVSGAKSFFDRSEIKDLMAYLQLVANTSNDQSFLRIINKPVRKIGSKSIEKLVDISKEKNISLFDAIPWVKKTDFPDSTWRSVHFFSDWIQSLTRRSPLEVFDLLVKDIDYKSWLELKADSPTSAEKQWKRVSSFRTWMSNIIGESDDISLSSLLFKLQLSENFVAEVIGGTLSLTTIHAAKGLEFSNVFLCGFEDGLLPHKNSTSKTALEEEVRLAYVAITRAKRNLTISYAKTRSQGGKMYKTKPSRFLTLIVDSKQKEAITSPIPPDKMFRQLRDMLSE